MPGPERPLIPRANVDRPPDPIDRSLTELTMAMSDLTVTRENLSIEDLVAQREKIGQLASYVVQLAPPARLQQIKNNFILQTESDNPLKKNTAEATLNVLYVAEQEKQRRIDEASK